jgi:hypothetical protein
VIPTTEDQLKALVSNPEGLSLEFKASDALHDINDRARKELAKDATGMANAAGGLIVYGVRERWSDPRTSAHLRSSAGDGGSSTEGDPGSDGARGPDDDAAVSAPGPRSEGSGDRAPGFGDKRETERKAAG